MKIKKAIVLTYAPVTAKEKKLLQNTGIFKIACNTYCADLKPDIRLTADDIVDKCLECDNIPVVSLNYDFNKERVISAVNYPKRHSSLLSCLDYLYFNGYNAVLLVASNPDSATCKINYSGIDYMKDYIYLWKYTEGGNFNIPHKTIEDFIMLTDDEKILGIKETEPRKMFTKTLFTDACMYEVCVEGKNNKSIENGLLMDSILPMEFKQRLINGETEFVCNGLTVKRITNLEPVVEAAPETTEEKEEEIVVEKVAPKKKTVTKKKVRNK